MPSKLYTYGEVVKRTTNVCACCGAFGHSLEKLDNDRVSTYKNFINIIAGEFENVDNEKYKVTTVQTKNGPVTVGYRHAW